MAAAPALPSQSAQVKQELIVTRLAHRLGLRQETVWARLGELKRERKQKEQHAARPGPRVQTAAARTTAPADGAVPKAKAGPAAACEKQLVELLLADPALVPTAAAAISPGELSHTGLRRILAELYTLQAAGVAPDLDGLRERLPDRPDLFDAATDLRFIGQGMGRDPDERAEWLQRVLKRFTELKVEAERRAMREQLGSRPADDGDAAVELLRKLQQTAPARPAR
jgi:DNA primase